MKNIEYQFGEPDVFGKELIRYCSDLNPWIDFVVIVDPENKEKAEKIIESSMIKFWKEDNYDPYGDIIERELASNEIACEIIYHDSDDVNDEYEEAWEKYIIHLKDKSKCILSFSS